ncbi:MAG: hypothetical protein KJ621_09085 [Proteobacteria bacterium]|nr:hypothetical protein [Pseudomonadota bacterium]
MSAGHRFMVLIVCALTVLGLGARPAGGQQLTDPNPDVVRGYMYSGAGLNVVRRYLNTYNPWDSKSTFWQNLYALPKLSERYRLFDRPYPRYYLNTWDVERNPLYRKPVDPNQDTYRRLVLHRLTAVPDYDTAVRVTPVWDWEKKALAELEKRWALIERGVVILDQDTTGLRPTWFYWDRPNPPLTVRPTDVIGMEIGKDPTVPVPRIIRRLLNPNLETPVTQGAHMPEIRRRLEQQGIY